MKPLKFNKIYFTGASHACVYHAGVVKWLQKHSDISRLTFYGCSSGALISLTALLFPVDEVMEIYRTMEAKLISSIRENIFSLSSYQYTEVLVDVLKFIYKRYPNAHELVSGKLNIGVSSHQKFRWYNKFRSFSQLANIIMCSCHIPFLSTYNSEINNIKCFDGVACVDYEHIPKDTFIVCPMNMSYANLNGNISGIHGVLPIPSELIDIYYKKGYNDMKRCMKNENFILNINRENTCQKKEPNIIWYLARLLQYEECEHTYTIDEFE